MPTDLGCFNHQETIDFGIDAQSTGAFTFKTNLNGWEWKKEVDFTSGADIKLDISATSLNEDYAYTFEVLDPSGSSLGLFYAKIKTLVLE